MFNQPATFKQSQHPWYTQTWVRWPTVWLIGIVIGLPCMVLIARIGGGRVVTTLVRTALVAINGPAIQSYVVADAISTVVTALIPGAASGAVIGLAQAMLLPHRLRPARTWILASVCGGALAW